MLARRDSLICQIVRCQFYSFSKVLILQNHCCLASCIWKALYSDSKIKENVEDADLQAQWCDAAFWMSYSFGLDSCAISPLFFNLAVIYLQKPFQCWRRPLCSRSSTSAFGSRGTWNLKQSVGEMVVSPNICWKPVVWSARKGMGILWYFRIFFTLAFFYFKSFCKIAGFDIHMPNVHFLAACYHPFSIF